MSKLETNTIDTVSGTSTLQVGSTNTTTITLGASGDTINIPSGATIANSGTATGFGGANTPAFYAEGSGSSQTITDATFTKIQISSEVYDTDNAYDPTTNYRFTVPSGEAGKYLFGMGVFVESTSSLSDARLVYNAFYKNGSQYQRSTIDYRNNYGFGASPAFTTTMDLSVGDYVEAFAAFDSNGGGTGTVVGGNSFLWGIKLIT